MPGEDTTLLTEALTDLESARDYLDLDDAEDDAVIAMLVNHATSVCERYTQRKLKSRTYTDERYDGCGTKELIVREWPITAVSALKYEDASGTSTALDTTAMRFDDSTVFLPNDSFPTGRMNILATFTAGFLVGTHDRDLALLEHACLRLVQVMYHDWKENIGRGTSVAVQGFALQYIDARMPKDVMGSLDLYRRLL